MDQAPPPPPTPRKLQPWERHFFLAAHSGDVAGLLKIYAEHAAGTADNNHNFDVNVTDEAGYTPLFIAILQGQLATVQTLVVSLGADIFQRAGRRRHYYHQNTPLQCACREGHLDIVLFLVQQGADPHEQQQQQQQHEAEETSVQPQSPQQHHGTETPPHQVGNLLHMAAMYNHTDIVQWLIVVLGMPVDTPCRITGQTALHVACHWHCTDTVTWLLTHGGGAALWHVADVHGQTALHHAVARRRRRRPVQRGMTTSTTWTIPRQLVKNVPLLQARDRFGRTALHVACHTRSATAVMALLQAGANPLDRDTKGCTPLYEVATGGNPQLLQDMLSQIRSLYSSSSAVSQSSLLSKPQSAQRRQQTTTTTTTTRISRQELVSELQRTDAQGYTAMHHAIARGETAVVEILLRFGVPVTPLPDSGTTTGNKTVLHLVGSGLVVNWEEYANRSMVPNAATWSEQYQLVSNWLLCYGKWFVQHEAVKDGWPPLGIPPVPCLPQLHGLWDLYNTMNGDNGPFCMSQLLLDYGAISVSASRNVIDGNLPFFVAAAAGQVTEVFVQLRAAAHEGLFQHLQEQYQSHTTASGSPKRPKPTTGKPIVTPPRI